MSAPKVTPKTAPKPEEAWRTARLIPTTGIGGPGRARATRHLVASRGDGGRSPVRTGNPRAHRRPGRPDPNVHRDPLRRRRHEAGRCVRTKLAATDTAAGTVWRGRSSGDSMRSSRSRLLGLTIRDERTNIDSRLRWNVWFRRVS